MRTLTELGPHVIWPHRLAAAWSFASEEQWTRFMLRLPQLTTEGWLVQRDPGFLFEVEEASQWVATVQTGDDGNLEVELGIEVGSERINLLPLLPDIRRALIEGGRRETVHLGPHAGPAPGTTGTHLRRICRVG
jgi:hypothetical protein